MMVTPFRQEQLSLPITHARFSSAIDHRRLQRTPRRPDLSLEPGTSCYKFILLRPKISARPQCRYD